MNQCSQENYFKLGRTLGFTPSDGSPDDGRLMHVKVSRRFEKSMTLLEIVLGPEALQAFSSGHLKHDGQAIRVTCPMVATTTTGHSNAKVVNLTADSMVKAVHVHPKQVFATNDVTRNPDMKPDPKLMVFWLVLKATADPDGVPSPWEVQPGLFQYIQKNTKPSGRESRDEASTTTWILFTNKVSAALCYHAHQKAAHGSHHDIPVTEAVLFEFGLSLQALAGAGDGKMRLANHSSEESMFGDYWVVTSENQATVSGFLAAQVEENKYGRLLRAKLVVKPSDNIGHPIDLVQQTKKLMQKRPGVFAPNFHILLNSDIYSLPMLQEARLHRRLGQHDQHLQEQARSLG